MASADWGKRMLETVSKIDWNGILRGCSIPTDYDVPSLLRNLVSDAESVRANASYLLFDLGCRCPQIVPHLIPFLLELVQHASDPTTGDSYRLLNSLVRECGHFAETVESGEPALQEQISSAFLAGLIYYERHLADSTPLVRAEAARAIGQTASTSSIPLLTSRLSTEIHPIVIQAIIEALHAFHSFQSVPVVAPFLSADSPDVQVDAASMVASLSTGKLADTALRVLFDAAIQGAGKTPAGTHAYSALRSLGSETMSRAVAHWLEQMPLETSKRAGRIHNIMVLVFCGPVDSSLASSPHSLTPAQRAVLEAAVSMPEIWTSHHANHPPAICYDLADAKLPTTHAGLCAFLA